MGRKIARYDAYDRSLQPSKKYLQNGSSTTTAPTTQNQLTTEFKLPSRTASPNQVSLLLYKTFAITPRDQEKWLQGVKKFHRFPLSGADLREKTKHQVAEYLKWFLTENEAKNIADDINDAVAKAKGEGRSDCPQTPQSESWIRRRGTNTTSDNIGTGLAPANTENDSEQGSLTET